VVPTYLVAMPIDKKMFVLPTDVPRPAWPPSTGRGINSTWTQPVCASYNHCINTKSVILSSVIFLNKNILQEFKSLNLRSTFLLAGLKHSLLTVILIKSKFKSFVLMLKKNDFVLNMCFRHVPVQKNLQ